MKTEELIKIPMENIYKNIVPNVYVLHSTGGYHYFSQCSLNKNIKDIYRQNIWPWIETLDNKTSVDKKTRFARPTSRDPYPKLNLRVNGTKINHKSSSAYPIKTFYMHLLVAKGFIKNKNNLPVVDHKNSITCDYRIDNLRWSTYSQNNSNKRPRIGPDKMYDIQEYRKSV